MSVYRDGEDHVSLEVPTVGGIVQVWLELAAAFTLFRLLDFCIQSDTELTQLYGNCVAEWEKYASKTG